MKNQQGAPEALRVEAAYGDDGKFIGYRLLSSGANGGLLVWADQKAMPGFRIGDHFVPGYREVIDYKPVALVEAQQPAPRAPRQAARSTDQVEEILRERDDAEDFIDALLDEVLGHERPEWSSAYGRADALNDVRERMTALHKPAVDKAWDQFQSAMEAPQQPAPSAAAATEVENLRKALQFYADKDHFNIADEGAWDTVSGEPQNYWCDEEGTATVEDGTIARLALAGHQIKFDADAAPQPSPTPQADSAPLAAPADIVVLEAALRAIHQAIDLIGEPDTERLRTVRRVLRGAVVVAEDSTAPQADSQRSAWPTPRAT